MSRIYFRLLLGTALCMFLAGVPQPSFAQRGGFHGGGGFHSGGGFHGGGSGFHGGGFGGSRGFGSFRGRPGFGGFNGRGFGSFRGGPFYGGRFYGGFGGYPHFYSGFGFVFDFGWPYWGGYPAYPYWYGYGPSWGLGPYAYYPYGSGYDPYDYLYDDPDWGYREHRYDRNFRDQDKCRDYRHDCPPPADNKPKQNGSPAKPSNGAAGEGSPSGNYVTINAADSGRRISYRGNESAGAALRPAVRNAIAALRAMPPAAREQQINSGRYASFSTEERELMLKATVQFRETFN